MKVVLTGFCETCRLQTGKKMGNISLKKFPIAILITLFVISSLFFSTSSFSGEQNWVFLGEIEGGLWFVDTDSISCKEDMCMTWTKMLSRIPVKKLSIEKQEYTKSLLEFNCIRREYRALQITNYDAQGNVITDTSPAESGKKYTVPEPISTILYDLACKQTSQQKEQQGSEKKYQEKGNEELQKSVVGTGGTEESVNQPQAKQSSVASPAIPEETVPSITTETVKKETEKNSQIAQEGSETMFTVQVAAFNNPSYAKSLETMLSKKGYETYIVTLKSKRGKLHKVRIGKFSDRKKAETLSEEIKKKEGLRAFVTLW